MYKIYPTKRYKETLEFIHKHIDKSEKILDLGIANPFSSILNEEGFFVENTKGEDLDIDQTTIQKSDATVITALEIAEHLLNPYTVLNAIKANKLIISVPLRLWFSSAYQSKTDKWDRHYHEFEPWQLNWLLEKTGWIIKDSKQWTHPVKKIGLRPILRIFTPRYYIVYAEKA